MVNLNFTNPPLCRLQRMLFFCSCLSSALSFLSFLSFVTLDKFAKKAYNFPNAFLFKEIMYEYLFSDSFVVG